MMHNVPVKRDTVAVVLERPAEAVNEVDRGGSHLASRECLEL
jgi:hypothetical protein